MNRCVFFDRDGVVNRSPGEGYVERWEDFELLPEFIEVLRAVREWGYEAVVVTNQRGVARGIMTMEALDEIHCNLKATLKTEHNLELLDIFYCPHGKGECDCRKPKPGMLIEAARKHDIDLAGSWMVGDNRGDVQAGRAAGCRTILVSGQEVDTDADFRAGSMGDLRDLLERLRDSGEM